MSHPRREGQAMLEEDVAAGKPAGIQQSRKSTILKQRHWVFQCPAAPAPHRTAMSSETQAEIKQEASQPVRDLGNRVDTSEGGSKDQHVFPDSPLHTTPAGTTSSAAPPPRSGFCCYSLPFGDTPGSLPSSQAASACSNIHLFQLETLPQKGGQEPQLLRGGMQTNGLCHARGCCSEPHLSSTNTTGMPSLPAARQAMSRPQHRPGLIKFGLCQQHLPARRRSALSV